MKMATFDGERKTNHYFMAINMIIDLAAKKYNQLFPSKKEKSSKKREEKPPAEKKAPKESKPKAKPKEEEPR